MPTEVKQDVAPYRLAAAVTGTGPDLLLIHGGAGSRNHWLRNVDALSRHFRVFALDLPGFGLSPDVPGEHGAEAYIELLDESLAGLGLSGEPLNLVGFSFGGAVAAALAVKLGGRVAKLSLIGPAGFKRAPGHVLNIRNLRAKYKTAEEYKAAVRHNLGLMMLWSPDAMTDEAVALHHENVVHTRFDSRILSQRHSMPGELARLRCRTQILYGEHDCLALPSVVARIDACFEVMPTATIEIIPAAGHWAQFENAAATNRALLSFLLAS